jgi:membrane associated rhomboid family serine protease
MMFVYLLSGIGGNLSSAIFLPQLPSVGASGALFGIVGMMLTSYIKNWGM